MKAFLLSTAALAWLAACGPRDRGTTARDTTSETGMAGDTMRTLAPDITPGVDTAVPSEPSTDSLSAAGVLTTLSLANLQEIREAQYVRQQASNAAVRTLARLLVTDHTANLQQGRALARRLGIRQRLPVDTGPVAPGDTAPPDLRGMRGAELDRAFVQRQIDVHQATIDRISNQMIPSSKDSELTSFLQETLTVMKGHLAHARRVQAQLSGAPAKNADSVAPIQP